MKDRMEILRKATKFLNPLKALEPILLTQWDIEYIPLTIARKHVLAVTFIKLVSLLESKKAGYCCWH
jgi:hypothetical protein